MIKTNKKIKHKCQTFLPASECSRKLPVNVLLFSVIKYPLNPNGSQQTGLHRLRYQFKKKKERKDRKGGKKIRRSRDGAQRSLNVHLTLMQRGSGGRSWTWRHQCRFIHHHGMWWWNQFYRHVCRPEAILPRAQSARSSGALWSKMNVVDLMRVIVWKGVHAHTSTGMLHVLRLEENSFEKTSSVCFWPCFSV